MSRIRGAVPAAGRASPSLTPSGRWGTGRCAPRPPHTRHLRTPSRTQGTPRGNISPPRPLPNSPKHRPFPALRQSGRADLHPAKTAQSSRASTATPTRSDPVADKTDALLVSSSRAPASLGRHEVRILVGDQLCAYDAPSCVARQIDAGRFLDRSESLSVRSMSTPLG